MELLRMIAEIRSPFLDVIVGLMTRLGEQELLIIVICALYWCVNKKLAYIMATVFFLSSLTVQGAKVTFRIERPWVIDPTFNPVDGAITRATGYSFPSGHTQTGAAFFGTLGAYFKQVYLKIFFFILVILVAFSRMYLGVHTLLDVAVSIAITFLIIPITFKIFSGDKECKKRLLAISLFILIYAVASIIYAFVLYLNGIIDQANVTDLLIAASAAAGFAVGMYIERAYIRFSIKTKNIAMQIVKTLIGILGLVAILEGLRLVIGTSIPASMIRYFLLPIWMMAIYTLIIKRFFPAPTTE
jgi:undecaprenyl-diphosphatase